MLILFTRITLIISFLFVFATSASANDSDVVNCNHAWTVVVLGSSTTFGTGATVYDSSWVAKFTAYLHRKNSQNVVYNMGIPGYTTYQNLRPTGYTPPANRPAPNSSFNITAALALHPDAIIINMPSNDVFNDYTIAEQQANFESAMHLADSAHVPVWVATVQPRNNFTTVQMNTQTLMRDWMFTRFGDKAVDFWTTVANADGTIAAFYDYDYAHVNNAGHELFYKRVKAETILDSLCNRVFQTLTVKAGNDISLTLPTSTASLNGSGTYSSLGGIITNYSWALVSSPAGSNPQIVSPNTAITNVNNLTEGRYSFSLTATDNALNTKSDTVNVVVSTRILIDFGPDITAAPDANGNYWNTVTETQNGIKITNAITSGNIATSIGFQVVNRIDGTFNVAGPGTNTGNTVGAIGDYPATVTSDFSFAEPSATNGQWRITGLEATKQYTIKFWGTRSVADDRVIQIKRADQSTWQEYNANGNTNYNTAAVFSFFGKTQMTFDIRVEAGSSFGHICLIDITRTTPANAPNLLPQAIAGDVTVSLPSTSGVLDGSASTDDDGAIVSYTWTQISGPSTAQVVSPNAAITTINNLVEGVYKFHLVVIDDSSATAATDVTVTVNTRILIDFGPTTTTSPDPGGKYWNNVADGLPGIKITNAIATGNIATTVDLEIINRIDGTFNPAGPGTNTGNSVGAVGDYPASSTTDFAFAHPTATNGQWKLTGLDITKQYTVKFWGARSVPVGDQRFIEIKRSDETNYQSYDGQNNTDFNNAAVFTFTGKTDVTFDIRVRNGDAFGYISLIDIKVITPPVDCTPHVVISSNQVAASCSGSVVTFTAAVTNGGSAPTYQWKRNGVNVNGANAAVYTTTTLLNNDAVSCFVTANTFCAEGTTATSNTLTVSVLPIVPQAGVISGPTDICSYVGSVTNAVYSIAPLANATTYTWTVPNGASIVSGQGTTSITVSFSSSVAAVDTIRVVGGPCTNSAPRKLTITKVLPAIPGAITGPTDACPYVNQPVNAVYSIAPVTNATSYTWTVPIGANIVSGQGTTSIQVSYTNSFISGSVKVTADASCGSRAPRSVTISRILPATPGIISGPASACPYIGTGSQVVYSIAPVANAASYTWTLPANMVLVNGQGTNSITVTFGAAFTASLLKVKAVANCASSGDRSLSITATTSSTPGTITGPTNACSFINTANTATYTIRKVSNAQSYIWTVPVGASIVSHPGGAGLNDTIITVSFNNDFVSGTVITVQSAGCIPSAARTLAVLRPGAPVSPGTITGPVNPCQFVGTATTATYSISKVADASSYIWVLSAGANATHPNGSGSNDTVILVTYSAGFSTGTISVAAVNGCGTSVGRSLAVKALSPVTTPTITGPADPCPWIGTSGATYKINKISNATSYTWTVPAIGATATHPNGTGVNDTIIIVNYTTAFVSGNITARADANCGSSSTRVFPLTKKLATIPGNITSTLISSCPNRRYTYSVPAIPANATSLTWTVPGGTIVSGQGTTTITVDYAPLAILSTVSVAGTNNCGNSLSVRSINVNLPLCVGLRSGETAGKNANPEPELLPIGLEVKVMPNPTYSDFRLIVSSNDKKAPIHLRLLDISNKVIEVKSGINSGETITIGSDYMKGVYICELIQGDKRKVVKLVKL